MNITKLVGVIFLAVYLILTGLATMAEVSLAPMAKNIVLLLGVASGILILISVDKFAKDKK